MSPEFTQKAGPRRGVRRDAGERLEQTGQRRVEDRAEDERVEECEVDEEEEGGVAVCDAREEPLRARLVRRVGVLGVEQRRHGQVPLLFGGVVARPLRGRQDGPPERERDDVRSSSLDPPPVRLELGEGERARGRQLEVLVAQPVDDAAPAWRVAWLVAQPGRKVAREREGSLGAPVPVRRAVRPQHRVEHLAHHQGVAHVERVQPREVSAKRLDQHRLQLAQEEQPQPSAPPPPQSLPVLPPPPHSREYSRECRHNAAPPAAADCAHAAVVAAAAAAAAVPAAASFAARAPSILLPAAGRC